MATGFKDSSGNGTVDSAKLSYTVKFIDTTNSSNVVAATILTQGSTTTARAQVPNGVWDISVESFYDGWPYAKGVELAYQVPGGQNPVSITMGRLPNAIALDHPYGQQIDLPHLILGIGISSSLSINLYNFSNTNPASISVNVSGSNFIP